MSSIKIHVFSHGITLLAYEIFCTQLNTQKERHHLLQCTKQSVDYNKTSMTDSLLPRGITVIAEARGFNDVHALFVWQVCIARCDLRRKDDQQILTICPSMTQNKDFSLGPLSETISILMIRKLDSLNLHILLQINDWGYYFMCQALRVLCFASALKMFNHIDTLIVKKVTQTKLAYYFKMHHFNITELTGT